MHVDLNPRSKYMFFDMTYFILNEVTNKYICHSINLYYSVDKKNIFIRKACPLILLLVSKFSSQGELKEETTRKMLGMNFSG